MPCGKLDHNIQKLALLENTSRVKLSSILIKLAITYLKLLQFTINNTLIKVYPKVLNHVIKLLHIKLAISQEKLYLFSLVFWLYVHLCTTFVSSVWADQGMPKQVRELDSLELELQLAFSYYLGSRNCTHFLQKSSQSS